MAESTFKQDDEETPVLFRIERNKRDYPCLTAVFPTLPASYDGLTMQCFAHAGQHSSCDFGWYQTTRAAKPAEYADLKVELESAPYGYRLKVCKRLQLAHRKAFNAAVRQAISHLHSGDPLSHKGVHPR